MRAKTNEVSKDIIDHFGILRSRNFTNLEGRKIKYVEISTEVLRDYGLDVYTDYQGDEPHLRVRPVAPRILEGEKVVPAEDVLYDLQEQALASEDYGKKEECLTCEKKECRLNRLTGKYDCLACGQSLNILEMVAIKILRQFPNQKFKKTSTGRVCTVAKHGKTFAIHIDKAGMMQGFEI